MIMPARSGQPETPLKPREVTAALRRIYPPSVPVRSSATLDGSVLVSLGNPAGRYLGVGRDDRAAANLLGWYLRQPVTISGHEYAAGSCAFTVAPDPGGRWPVHPGGSEAVPAYTTTSEVLGDFPANRIAMGLISLALEAGCRPHLSPWRSGHGRQYRVSLWHTDPELLFGCIDVGEEGGRFAAAYLQWGRGPETRHTDAQVVRQNLSSCRDLHRAETANRGVRPARSPRPPASRRAGQQAPRRARGRLACPAAQETANCGKFAQPARQSVPGRGRPGHDGAADTSPARFRGHQHRSCQDCL